MSISLRRPLLAGSLSLLLLSGCGGSEPTTATLPPPAAPDAPSAPPPLSAGCIGAGQEMMLLEYEGTAPTAVEGVVVPPGSNQEHVFTVPAGCSFLDVKVRLEWDVEVEDLDLELYFPDGTLATSSTNFNLLEGAAEEVLSVGNPPPGDYRIVVVGYANVETGYRGTASVSGGGLTLRVADLNDVPAGATPRVVVAVIDTGINPYHQFFHAGSPIYPAGAPPSAVTRDVLAEFGVLPQCVMELTRSGDFAADYAADIARGEWAKANLCEVVWFKGTNVLARSFSGGAQTILPDDEGDTHGVGTSAAVLGANPEAIVLFLEGVTDAAEVFAFGHPAVDMVSTSYGPIGSAPTPGGNLTDSFKGTYERGKLHFGACDNSPSTGVQDNTCGPWWSVGVAGFEETADNEPATSSGGRQSLSGNLVDFLADFTQTLPYCMACEDGYEDGVGGTSFATPRSAGTASRVLLQARRMLGHTRGIVEGAGVPDDPPLMATGTTSFTNWQLRRALEEAAWVPGVSDYDPVAGLIEFGPGYPIPPVAPWTVIGWGVLSTHPDARVIDQALVQLGLAPGEARVKDSGFCSWQTGLIDLRRAYWDMVNPDSETYLNPPQPDPFLPCS